MGAFDVGVVISNDSDLAEPVRILTRELGLKVGVLSPISNRRQPSRTLTRYASFVKRIRTGALAASQFPNVVIDADGKPIRKPVSW